MCSVNDEDEHFNEHSYNDLVDNCEKSGQSCKCGSVDIVLTQNLYGSFCKECFLLRIAHKFRSEFGKSRLIRDSENVAVSFSGGKKSTVLVNLIQEGRSKRAQKKLRFTSTLISILETRVQPCQNTTRVPPAPAVPEPQCKADHVETLLKRLKAADMPFYIYSLNQVYDSNVQPLLTNESVIENVDSVIKELMDNHNDDSMKKSFTNKTSQQSMNLLLRKELLVRICKSLNLRKILLGDNCEQLAVQLVSDVAQGRGSQLSYDVDFVDDRNDGVTFLKPMRTFLNDEIDTVISLKGLDYIEPNRSETRTIESLTEAFIMKLQSENKNTLSIICRTGEKLTTNKDNNNNRNNEYNNNNDDGGDDDICSNINILNLKCCLCKAIIDKPFKVDTANVGGGDNELNNIIKTGVNNVNINSEDGVCNKSSGNLCGRNECCSTKLSSSNTLSRLDLLKHSCYACRIIINDLNDPCDLPHSILNYVQTAIRRDKMKESINEYLINDNDDGDTNKKPHL